MLALAVEKSGQITGGINAKFASYADIREVLNPHMIEHGLSLGWNRQTIRTDEKGREIVTMHGEVSDGEESVNVEFEVMVPAAITNSRGSEVVNNAQRTANAASYCVRIATLRIFGMGAGNEDECERMSASGAETDSRDSAPQISEDAHWSKFLDGEWRYVRAPGKDAKLGELKDKELVDLVLKHPTHAGLVAWVADSRLMGNLQELGMLWSEFIKQEPGDWPDTLIECTPEQIKQAATATKAMKSTNH